MADLITELNGSCRVSSPSQIPHPLMTRCLGFCGAMSIFSSLRYCLGNAGDLNQLYLAMIFMPFGLFFDFMDGKVARWRQENSLLGQELDSLADLVCFILPSSTTHLASVC